MKDIGIVLFVSLVFAAHLRNAESKRKSLEDIKESLQIVRKICIDKVHVDPKLIDNANKGNFVPDRKLQCYYKCLMVMTKTMTKDDKIMEKAFIKNTQLMFLEELVQPVLKAFTKCRSITKKQLEGCELAYELAKCYYENNPELAFYP